MLDECLLIAFIDPESKNMIFLRFSEHENSFFNNISLFDGNMMDVHHYNGLKTITATGIYVYKVFNINQELGEALYLDGTTQIATFKDLARFNIYTRQQLDKVVCDHMETEWIDTAKNIIDNLQWIV